MSGTGSFNNQRRVKTMAEKNNAANLPEERHPGRPCGFDSCLFSRRPCDKITIELQHDGTPTKSFSRTVLGNNALTAKEIEAQFAVLLKKFLGEIEKKEAAVKAENEKSAKFFIDAWESAIGRQLSGQQIKCLGCLTNLGEATAEALAAPWETGLTEEEINQALGSLPELVVYLDRCSKWVFKP